MKCLICGRGVIAQMSLSVPTPEKADCRICFECVRTINNRSAMYYRSRGWILNRNALIISEIEQEKEIA